MRRLRCSARSDERTSMGRERCLPWRQRTCHQSRVDGLTVSNTTPMKVGSSVAVMRRSVTTLPRWIAPMTATLPIGPRPA